MNTSREKICVRNLYINIKKYKRKIENRSLQIYRLQIEDAMIINLVDIKVQKNLISTLRIDNLIINDMRPVK